MNTERKQAILEEITPSKGLSQWNIDAEKLAIYLADLEKEISSLKKKWLVVCPCSELNNKPQEKDDLETKVFAYDDCCSECSGFLHEGVGWCSHKCHKKDDLESRFNQMFYEPREDKRLSLLNFIRAEGKRRYREGALFANERNYLHAKQAGRKEAFEETLIHWNKSYTPKSLKEEATNKTI